MKFLELVNLRQSVRKYKNQAVERIVIDRCIEAARLAPSASNSQPWKFIVIDEAGLKNSIAGETYNSVIPFNKFAGTAPVIIVILLEKSKVIARVGGRIKKLQYNLIDLGIAAEHLCLQAAEEGLGTCMIGWFNEKKLKKILGLSKGKTIGLLITLGYPDESKRVKKRKTLEEISTYNLSV